MTEKTESPALAIGAVMGDIDAERSWGADIGALSIRVKGLRAGIDSPVRLNVIFHVDGRLKPNNFEGVRTGRFRRRDNHLIVQAAVPSGEVDDHGALLLSLLAAAVREAEVFARKMDIAQELTAIRSLVDALTDG